MIILTEKDFPEILDRLKGIGNYYKLSQDEIKEILSITIEQKKLKLPSNRLIQ